jgi:hypothetical protein
MLNSAVFQYSDLFFPQKAKEVKEVETELPKKKKRSFCPLNFISMFVSLVQLSGRI